MRSYAANLQCLGSEARRIVDGFGLIMTAWGIFNGRRNLDAPRVFSFATFHRKKKKKSAAYVLSSLRMPSKKDNLPPLPRKYLSPLPRARPTSFPSRLSPPTINRARAVCWNVLLLLGFEFRLCV